MEYLKKIEIIEVINELVKRIKSKKRNVLPEMELDYEAIINSEDPEE